MSVVIKAAGLTTEWFALVDAAEKTCFMLTGPFVGTVSLQYSNNPAYSSKGTDYVTDSTQYTAPGGPFEIPFGVARYARFVGSAWTSGTCVPSFAHTKNAAGQLFVPNPEKNNPQPVTA